MYYWQTLCNALYLAFTVNRSQLCYRIFSISTRSLITKENYIKFIYNIPIKQSVEAGRTLRHRGRCRAAAYKVCQPPCHVFFFLKVQINVLIYFLPLFSFRGVECLWYGKKDILSAHIIIHQQVFMSVTRLACLISDSSWAQTAAGRASQPPHDALLLESG